MLPVTTKQYKSMVKKISNELWDKPNLFERGLAGECVLNVVESHKPKRATMSVINRLTEIATEHVIDIIFCKWIPTPFVRKTKG